MRLADQLLATLSEKDRPKAEGLRKILSIIESTPTGRMLLASAVDSHLGLIIDDSGKPLLGPDTPGGYLPGQHKLYISPSVGDAGEVPGQFEIHVLAHELTHAHQFASCDIFGSCGRKIFLNGNLHDALLVKFLEEADANSAAIQVFHEIPKSRRKYIPAQQRGTSFYEGCHDAFGSSIRKDTRNLHNGKARYAAFRAFYSLAEVGEHYSAGVLNTWEGEIRAGEGFLVGMLLKALKYFGDTSQFFPPPDLYSNTEKQDKIISALAMPDGKPYLNRSVFTAAFSTSYAPEIQAQMSNLGVRRAKIRARMVPQPVPGGATP